MENNSRVELYNGIKFYEKDVLFDNHIFTQDIEITADVQYASAGFGIVLMNSQGDSIKEKSDSFLFKVGFKEISSYYSTQHNRTVLSQFNCLEAYTIQEHLKFKLIKNGKKVTIEINGKKILEEYLQKNIDKYNVGYYSSGGNIINNISISSNTPNGWTVNMKDTQGGYVNFIGDGFEIRKCNNNAEVEQSNIFLEKGVYHFQCELDDIDGENDIDYFIMPTSDDTSINMEDRFYNDKKNILNKSTGVFVVRNSSFVNLKFIGTNGSVSKFMISKNKDDSYVSTVDSHIEFDGSYIDITLTDVAKVKWEGIVTRTPEDVNGSADNQVFGIILDSRTQIRPRDLSMSYNVKHQFEFNIEDYQFTAKKNGVLIHEEGKFILKNLANKITIFKNMKAEISSLVLYKKNGTIIDVNIQDQNYKSVPGDINSPIIVTDRYEVPLDLSSSYRLCEYDDYSKYIFTNWEREYFNSEPLIHLENKIIKEQDSIIIYGLKKGYAHNLDNILTVDKDNINSIDKISKHYEKISILNIDLIDKVSSIIYINSDITDKYDMIIVDYLKADSYCINYDYISNAYRVDISSTSKDNKIVYNSNISNEDFSQINNHKITNINGNINSYIVMRKEL